MRCSWTHGKVLKVISYKINSNKHSLQICTYLLGTHTHFGHKNTRKNIKIIQSIRPEYKNENINTIFEREV